MPAGVCHTTINSSLVVTLHDGTRGASLDRHSYNALAAILTDAARTDAIRSVILRGFAGCFCQGADLNEFTDPESYPGLIDAVTMYFRALADFPKPLLACVDGEATGVGCTTLFHCDMIFASSSSTFRVPFVDFGLVPDAATSLLAPERLGYTEAFRFFCLGQTLDAERALSIGLASELCDGSEEETFALALDVARQVSKKPSIALETTRRLLRGEQRKVRNQIDREIELFRDALRDERTIRRIKRLARMAA